MEAKNFPKTNSHITVTGKVKINMQAESYGIYPVKENRFFCGNQKGITQFPKLIGNKKMCIRDSSSGTSGIFDL